MNQRSSRLLRVLRENRFPATMKMNLTDPRVAEMAGLAGFDALWLCQEHVPTDWVELENTIRAAKLHDVDTLVRVAKGGYSNYVRPLEADATGIIIPHVESADEARQIVEWTRFHPVGKRALDSGNADGGYATVDIPAYIAHANAEKLIVLQIESPEGLAQVEAIAAVPGFNGFLFGPGDFSHRVGQAGQLTNPETTAARRRVAQAARKHGKFVWAAGIYAPFAELVADGHNVFNVGSDVGGLNVWFRQRLDLLRNHVKDLPPGTTAKQNPYG